MKRSLYIGRFQVFHLGHLDVLEHIDATPDVDELLVMLGSTQYDHRRKSPVAPWAVNPFTAEERSEMITRALTGRIRKPWSIHPVPDYHDWPRWHQHLVVHLPPFHVLFTSDREEKRFFEEAGTEVRGFPRNRSFHAATVRQAIAGGGEWRSRVLPEVAEVLERIGAADRLRELYARDEAGTRPEAVAS